MNNCPHCKSEVQAGWKACPACAERLPEMPICHFCGAEMQQGWKACPTCGNRVEGDQGASVNILEMFEEMLQTYRRKQAEENNNDSQ